MTGKYGERGMEATKSLKNLERRNRVLPLFLAGMVVVHIFVIWNARHLIRKGYPDFTIFYSAAKIVREGLGARLYDPQVQYQVQLEFASGVSIRQGALPYNHPAFEALFFVPLTYLPYLTAFVIWDALNLVMLGLVLRCLRPHAPFLQRLGLGKAWFACLAFFPVCVALLQGQDMILLLLLFALAFVSLKRGNDIAAGAWLGLGLFRFHLVLLLVLILLLRKRFKVLIGFAAIACFLMLVSVTIVGWPGMLHYPQYVWYIEQTMGHGAIVPSDMPNLRGLIASLLTDLLPKQLVLLVTALLSLAVITFVGLRQRMDRSVDLLNLAFSEWILAVVLLSYHAFAYDLCLLLLPIVLVLDDLQRRPGADSVTRRLLLIPILILFFSPLQMALWLKLGQLSLLATVLFAWLWGMTREIQRQEPQPS
ncbi:MAG TPA: glycosyltransferase family 87 protein [Terriglobales bacterium]|nr:glycosyltransferase family 87 protein [Terriglobales bacterium]